VIKVDVCICTYRRDTLDDTLSSISRQQLEGVEVRVIVADNDAHALRREHIEATAKVLRLSLQYVHAPACNISIARNACLDAVAGDWIAFIDDDEIASPTWLSELLHASSGRDIVFGLVQAQYPSDAPQWIIDGDFHSSGLKGNDADWNGHTGNALIKASFVRDHRLRFAKALGRTGGEDTLLFFEAMQAGAKFGYAPSAVVSEFTDPSRVTLRWLLARRFRSGQTHHIIMRREGSLLAGTLSAAPKLAWSLAAAVISAGRRVNAVRHLLRGGLHAGVIAAAIGIAPYEEYDGGKA
jgi:succinoglycan biosynthesis protein ExoM